MKAYLLGFYAPLDLDIVFFPVAVVRAKNEDSALKKARKAMQDNCVEGFRFEHAGFEDDDGSLRAVTTTEESRIENGGEEKFLVKEIQEIS